MKSSSFAPENEEEVNLPIIVLKPHMTGMDTDNLEDSLLIRWAALYYAVVTLRSQAPRHRVEAFIVPELRLKDYEGDEALMRAALEQLRQYIDRVVYQSGAILVLNTFASMLGNPDYEEKLYRTSRGRKLLNAVLDACWRFALPPPYSTESSSDAGVAFPRENRTVNCNDDAGSASKFSSRKSLKPGKA